MKLKVYKTWNNGKNWKNEIKCKNWKNEEKLKIKMFKTSKNKC